MSCILYARQCTPGMFWGNAMSPFFVLGNEELGNSFGERERILMEVIWI